MKHNLESSVGGPLFWCPLLWGRTSSVSSWSWVNLLYILREVLGRGFICTNHSEHLPASGLFTCSLVFHSLERPPFPWQVLTNDHCAAI